MNYFEETTYPNRPSATIPPSEQPTYTEQVLVTHDGVAHVLDVEFFEVPKSVAGRGAGAVTTTSEHTRVAAAFLDVVDGEDIVHATELRVKPPIGEDETRRQQAIDSLLGVLGLTRTVEA